MRLALRRRCFGVSLVTLLGCAVGPDFKQPEAPTVTRYTEKERPTRTVDAAGRAQSFQVGQRIAADWWRILACPPLDAILVDTLAHNPGLEAARASLRRSEHLLRAGCSILPVGRRERRLERATERTDRLRDERAGYDLRPHHRVGNCELYSRYLGCRPSNHRGPRSAGGCAKGHAPRHLPLALGQCGECSDRTGCLSRPDRSHAGDHRLRRGSSPHHHGSGEGRHRPRSKRLDPGKPVGQHPGTASWASSKGSIRPSTCLRSSLDAPRRSMKPRGSS